MPSKKHFICGSALLSLLVVTENPAEAQSTLVLEPVRWGISQRYKERVKGFNVPTWGVGGRPVGTPEAPTQEGRVGFVRHRQNARAWAIWVDRTGLIFDLSGLPEAVAINRATLQFTEVDIVERGARIRKGGDRCLSAVSRVLMLTTDGLEAWQPSDVETFAETKPLGVSMPNVAGATRSADVTRLVQHAYHNRDAYGSQVGLILAGHREGFPRRRVKNSRRCDADIYNATLTIE